MRSGSRHKGARRCLRRRGTCRSLIVHHGLESSRAALRSNPERPLAIIPISGTFIPNMGTKRRRVRRVGLGDALFSPVQQRVLRLLFGQPARRFQSAELIRLAGSGTGAVHRQLGRLVSAGWISASRAGNQKYYQANSESPAFRELQQLVVKTFGLVGPIKQALAGEAERIQAAFVYGSVARGEDHAMSDIDLMVISARLTHQELFEALQPVERQVGRAINVNVLTPAEWRDRRGDGDSFVTRIVSQPTLLIVGTDADLK